MVTWAAGARHLPFRCEVAVGTFLQENVTSLSLPEVTFEKIFFFLFRAPLYHPGHLNLF